MLESTPAVIKEAASSKVIALPELMEHIGHYLQQSDHASCTLVCRAWNEIFTPLLWAKLDTHTKPWSKIMYKLDTGEIQRDELEGWCKTIFEKHGHRIRHLGAHWNTIVEAASLETSNCRNLVSLSTELVKHSHVTPTTVLALVADFVDFNNDDNTHEPRQFPWVSEEGMTKYREDIRYRGTVERFFLLIRQNLSLVRIQFPIHGVMKDVSQEYVFEALSQLRNLKELNLVWLPLALPTLLDTVPRLERLQGHSFPDLGSLQHQYPNLRTLSIRTYILFTNLLSMLNHLPGLEELQIESVLGEPESVVPYKEACRIVETSAPFLRLRTLQVDNQLRPGDKYMALFLRMIPNLIRLVNLTLVYAVKNALWEYCYFLDEIRIVDGPNVEAWRERRAQQEKESQQQ
ncbi:hypothetical protein BG015_002479 [Linnemannia schmuckeri]|uniref:F-box domain-containing protein n=1 Tax=Linnemannia schmuckeri TaxID=64567 RepID=A0A9P5V654_9FUNG|nr:hypothetical protein BG015_002479 [Linnemannia schmuckeri]